jgi:hypothetical protein
MCLPVVGVGGVMWIYAVLYLVSAVMTLFLTLPEEETASRVETEGGRQPAAPDSAAVSWGARIR